MDPPEQPLPPEWATNLPEEKASEPESWPPRTGHFFDWSRWTTDEAYHDPKQDGFTPDFSRARSRLDYSYHRVPVRARLVLQDAILGRVIGAAPSSASAPASADGPDRPERRGPWIVFTAGPMGVGKGYALSTLHGSGLFPLDEFLRIDPDMIKSEIPEMSGYLRADPASAATRVHRESTQMADVLFEHAVLGGASALVDGSLRDVDYHRSLFDRIRSDHSEYRIAIVQVSAEREVIHERAERRAERTGRAVPTEVLDASIEQVPRSVRSLSPHADVTFEISNDDGSPLRLVAATSRGTPLPADSLTWDVFARTWSEEETADIGPKEALAVGLKCALKPVLAMALCWEDKLAHEAVRCLWSKAYPNLCPRCTLYSDSQCGVCWHGRHLCECEECERVCPVRQALRNVCAVKKCFF